MKINFSIDANQTEHVDFYLKELTRHYQEIAKQIQNADGNLWGYSEDSVFPLDLARVSRFYTNNQRVMVTMNQIDYEVKQRIYQLAEELPTNFIQISRGEIVNFDLVDHLELSETGTIKLVFKNQTYSYVSRRYVSKIKRRLCI